jgi:hypothetical protein
VSPTVTRFLNSWYITTAEFKIWMSEKSIKIDQKISVASLKEIIIIIIIIIIKVVSCHRPFLPGTSIEPAVIPTAQASSFTLQYFTYYV